MPKAKRDVQIESNVKERRGSIDSQRLGESYARLYDDLLDNPKMSVVGPLGFALYCAGLVYSHRNRTDGFIPDGKVASLIDASGIAIDVTGASPLDWTGRPRRVSLQAVLFDPALLGDSQVVVPTAYRVACGLEAAGLWDPDARGGWTVHDYLKHNSSRVGQGQTSASGGRARASGATRDRDGRFVVVKPALKPAGKTAGPAALKSEASGSNT